MGMLGWDGPAMLVGLSIEYGILKVNFQYRLSIVYIANFIANSQFSAASEAQPAQLAQPTQRQYSMLNIE